jgi:hypothetical protein
LPNEDVKVIEICQDYVPEMISKYMDKVIAILTKENTCLPKVVEVPVQQEEVKKEVLVEKKSKVSNKKKESPTIYDQPDLFSKLNWNKNS